MSAIRLFAIVVASAMIFAVGPPADAGWVTYSDQTSSRLVAPADRGVSDIREKDYAWGDVDHDGDIDLVIIRKEPFTSSGKDQNVLLVNENGVLTDRTGEFVTAADVPGDQGFMTPTNDRDAVLADVNNDGWLDIITAPTYMDADPKHIGHPRIYLNQGCSGACAGTDDWNGFLYEADRIPEMLSDSLQAGCQPRFCAVAAGDVNEDGFDDLWFIDYDNGQPAGCDFNNKLLLNQGAANPGFFTDVTETAIAGGFNVAAFGASGYVEDMNGDGFNDLVKQHAGESRIAYNDPSDPGFFDQFQTPYGNSVYFIQVGELNHDDKLDLVASDDGQDRYLLNQGNNAAGIPSWLSFAFTYSNFPPTGGSSNDDGFGGNSVVADLNNDGWDDVVITDVDVDIGGCGRRTHIYRNLGGVAPGGNVNLQEQTEGTGCNIGAQFSCKVAGTIPASSLTGTHDVATFDINGDGWLDMVVGRCSSTEVYINQPPSVPAAGVPDGDTIPGPQLVVGKEFGIGDPLSITWGDSCQLSDADYAIYEGQIGDFASHERVMCTTGGSTTQTFLPRSGSRYYLTVPISGSIEGSYGVDGNGIERPLGPDVCRPQVIGSCD